MIQVLQEDRKSERRSQKIVETAQDRLCRSPYTLLKMISCDYDEGVLFLRGRLPNYHHKQMAQETVRRLDGVSQIVNEIEVEPLHVAH